MPEEEAMAAVAVATGPGPPPDDDEAVTNKALRSGNVLANREDPDEPPNKAAELLDARAGSLLERPIIRAARRGLVGEGEGGALLPKLLEPALWDEEGKAWWVAMVVMRLQVLERKWLSN